MEKNVPGSSLTAKISTNLTVGEKKIILRVFQCLERDHPGLKDEVVDRCVDYTGASKTSIYRILREQKIYGQVQAPKPKSGRRKIEVGEDAKYAIRRTVHTLFKKDELPTLKTVLKAVSKNKMIPKMGKETLRKILHGMKLYGYSAPKTICAPLVIPMKNNKNLFHKITKDRQDDHEKEKPEEDKPNTKLTIDELAAQELINDGKKHPHNNEPSKSLLSITKDKNSFDEAKESTLDDYENMPVSDFRMAMLRGMGWKEGMGIGKNPTKSTTVMKLKYHMRNHTGERPYVCSVCGRGFTVNTILLRHMRVHSGERPYVCVTCGEEFSRLSTLNTHMKVHAPSPKYDNQEQEHMTTFHSINEQKYQSQQQPQAPDLSNLLMQKDNRMLQAEPIQRMIQPDNSRMIPNDESRILTDTPHLLSDNRGLIDNTSSLTNDGTRLLVNVTESPRLSENDNTRLLGTDNVLLTQDNKLISNVNINENNRLLGDNSRLLTNDNAPRLAVIDISRLLADNDKYLANYDSYHRGHL